jgi:hypothetical protein
MMVSVPLSYKNENVACEIKKEISQAAYYALRWYFSDQGIEDSVQFCITEYLSHLKIKGQIENFVIHEIKCPSQRSVYTTRCLPEKTVPGDAVVKSDKIVGIVIAKNDNGCTILSNCYDESIRHIHVHVDIQFTSPIEFIDIKATFEKEDG